MDLKENSAPRPNGFGPDFFQEVLGDISRRFLCYVPGFLQRGSGHQMVELWGYHLGS